MYISKTCFSVKKRLRKVDRPFLLIILSIIISLSLTACGGSSSSSNPNQDTTSPVITILGDNPTVISQDAIPVYSDAGATAKDNIDGEIDIQTSGSVDTSTKGEYTITYTATDSSGNTSTAIRTVQVNSVTADISINRILITTSKKDPGLIPIALKVGNVYNFVIDFTSSKRLSKDITFTLALIPDVSETIAEGNPVTFELGSDTIYLTSEISDEHTPIGRRGLFIANIMIPKSIDTSKNYILMAYLHEGELLKDGYEIDLADATSARKEDQFDPRKLVGDISVNILPKTENDITLHSVFLLDRLAFVEKNKTAAIKNDYMALPFIDSELQFFSNNDSDAETILRAFWVTPGGEEVPLYFYDESGLDENKMVDRKTITVPSSKRPEGDQVSKIPPYIYPAELYLNKAGWEQLIEYAGDPTQGEGTYQAKIKYRIESSEVNVNNKNDTFEVVQFTLELASLSIRRGKDRPKEKKNPSPYQQKTLLRTDEIDHDVFEYKKSWRKSWGNSSKVALGIAASVNAGVDLLPVPTIDAVATAGVYLDLFNNENTMLEYNLKFSEGLNVITDDSVSENYTFNRGVESTFILFNAVLNVQGVTTEEVANKNAKDPSTIEDAKKDIEKETSLEKLVFKKEWKEDKTILSKTFTVGVIPLTVEVGIEFVMPLELGLQPNGLGVELFANLNQSIEVIAEGGVGFSFSSAGVNIDFLVVEDNISANAGLKITYDFNEEQFMAKLFTEGELEIEAIKGEFSLFAQTQVSYPCGWSWFKNIKWCSKTNRFTLNLYTTPAAVNRTGNNAFSLWEYENSLITLDI